MYALDNGHNVVFDHGISKEVKSFNLFIIIISTILTIKCYLTCISDANVLSFRLQCRTIVYCQHQQNNDQR